MENIKAGLETNLSTSEPRENALPVSDLDRERAADVELELLEREAEERERTDLGAFITTTSPEFERPDHLEKLLDIFDRIEAGESIFSLVEVAPRHGKSETAFHAIARALRFRPVRAAYVSYSGSFSLRKSRRTRDLAAAAGTAIGKKRDAESNFADSAAVGYWETSNGGSLTAGGRGGAWKGMGFDLIIYDEAFRDRAEYESPVIREKVWESWVSVLRDRVEPGGSVVIMHQRWGDDDLIGKLKKQEGGTNWEIVTLPAISDEGEPLWPERYDLEALDNIRQDVGPYDWASQFQQKPIPRGDTVFEDAVFYSETPREGKRFGVGIDLAYSTGTKNDHSVAISGVAVGKKLYLLEMIRHQKTILTLTPTLKTFGAKYPGAPWAWFVGGQEKAVAATLKKDLGVRLKIYPARADKFTRALSAAAAWKRGEILIPEGAPWVPAFLREMHAFTGTSADTHDDIIDALVALYEVLIKRAGMLAALD